jgi:ABC-2 type transport system permease protein
MAGPLMHIIKKEVLEMVRDPRLLLGMILVPLLIFPIMGMAMSSSVNSITESASHIDLGIVNLDDGNRSQDSYYNQDEFDQMVNGTEFQVDLFMVIEPGFSEAIDSNGSATVLLYTPMSTYSMSESLPSEMVAGYVGEYQQSVLRERLARSYPGANITDIENPVQVGSLSVVDGKIVTDDPGTITSQMMTQSIMIPMVLMILLIMAAQLAATSVAMEKEEKTIETLLTTPVPRSTILFGKIGGVAVISAIAVVAYIFGFSFYISQLRSMAAEGTSIDLAAIGLAPSLPGMTLLFVTLFLALLSALSLAVLVASFTEDVRSAQTLMGLLYFPIFIPSLVLMFMDISQVHGAAQVAILAIPFTYPALAAKAMYTGEFAIILFGIVYQVIFTGIVIYTASRFFSSEKILTARFRLRKGKGFHSGKKPET